ncbi:MAG: L-histidine N(alpha)-methyltransferase [Patescibacteria group bacterium]
METKNFYHDGIWDAIVNHQGFDIGRREFEALIRFLPVVVRHVANVVNVLHLGVGNGREVTLFANQLKVGKYVINDICAPSLERVTEQARVACPVTSFSEARADIEQNGVIQKLRQGITGQTLIVLVGNAVIFSNRSLDDNIRQAMERDDLFLVTAETPHEKMSQSYTIEPVYRLLAQSGMAVNADNTSTRYDESDQCLKMSCRGEVLLSSYKPKPGQLRQRLKAMEMAKVALCEYQDTHMVAGLFRKERLT